MSNEKDDVNVIDISEFKARKPEYVYECACGGQHWYLNDDGTVRCRSCNLINETLEWRKRR